MALKAGDALLEKRLREQQWKERTTLDSNFWLSKNAPQADVDAEPLGERPNPACTMCLEGAADKATAHRLQRKKLVNVVWTTQNGGGKSCPGCSMQLRNGPALEVLVPCGHCVCGSCVKTLVAVAKSGGSKGTCLVCSAAVTKRITLQGSGTGFASHDGDAALAKHRGVAKTLA